MSVKKNVASNNNALKHFFVDTQNCDILREDKNKRLLRAHGWGENRIDLFVKIYKYPHFIHSRIHNWHVMGGAYEYKVCRRLQRLQIPTPEPIGYAVQKNLIGYPSRSIYAAKWLHHTKPLGSLVRNGARGISIKKERWPDLLMDIGRFVGTLNRKLVIAKDLNVSNILTRWESASPPSFFLVDYESIVFQKKYDLSKCMKGLSHIGAFFLPIFGDAIIWMCKGYIAMIPELELNRLVKQVTDSSIYRIRKWEKKIDDIFAVVGDHLDKRDTEQYGEKAGDAKKK